MIVTLRPVAPSDCDLICRHRHDLFLATGDEEATKAALSPAYRNWQQQALQSGVYFGFIAEVGRDAVGGVGLMVIDWPPHQLHPEVRQRGYVLNVFVEPDHRGKGIAKRLMAASDAAFKERGVKHAVLTATAQARPLYERDGWRQTAQMTKKSADFQKLRSLSIKTS
ncbi:ribosomal protein S18 acetylase RimI-like enzyme [Roseibium hamelinense]|uniref:Ribosomal protein S18 acetylase RimI-like enzyme n=1 Tax=Roseibium hamelinense TaxID=150831 RepID=A0A562T1M0_9HYPH|nr:GNAT family N-acetyltransferase [Roseibium hamelinense]MTI44484.1 GNAT family N-acetyltransferase [Roseibium hamelinense]TWI87452.1 ribosomal protein S18 acetylase RimI-like enzyme [Roseibium hamelinense]